VRRRRQPPWQPDYGAPAGPQRRYLVELGSVFELLNAGSVGAGKTDAALMGPVVYPEYRAHPRFKAIVLRYSSSNKVKTSDAFEEFFQRIVEPGRWPRYVGGRLNRTDGVYRFRSGGEVIFTSTRDLRSLQGPEFQYVFPDEITHWPDPADYLYVAFTRARSADGLPIRIRPTTNPGGPGHAWVRERWGPWLASDYLTRADGGGDRYAGAASLRALGFQERHAPDGRPLPPCESGQVLHYAFAGGQEHYVPAGTPGALTRSCLRTRTSDNAALAKHDPTYGTRVQAVSATLAAQLGQDEWDVSQQDAGVFGREWWPLVQAAPVELAGVCRRWDFAWTKKKRSDWSVGLKFGWTKDGRWYVLNVARLRGNPDEVYRVVRQTAEMDGRDVVHVLPVDYASGIAVVSTITSLLAGYQVEVQQERGLGSKEVRIACLQPQVQAGRVSLVSGAWVGPFLDEAAHYPTGPHDDQLDALAGAFLWAAGERGAEIPDVDPQELARGREAASQLWVPERKSSVRAGILY